jgi:alpha-ketoglutarate-dependent taurine dioxygenase
MVVKRLMEAGGRQGPEVASSVAAEGNPFLFGNHDAYRRWRDRKLAAYPQCAAELVVEIRNPRAPTAAESAQIRHLCRTANMAIYAGPAGEAADKEIPCRLGAHFGLHRLDRNLLADEDAITSLEVAAEKSGRGYIPYSNRRLLWHTDGYYNPPTRRIRAFVLHCARPAASGGENALLDPEIAYILLRETDPECVRALMAADAMTIPANTEAGELIRDAQGGPVFEVDPQTGCLHMRYTARTRSIAWKQDPSTAAAARRLEELLAGESPYVFRHRLEAGQGLLCNNVLHNRTEFTDDAAGGRTRLVYRARYHDRIAGTDWRE